MNLFGVMEMSGTALRAQRIRAEVVTSNLANAETTRTDGGGPYQRKQVVFRSRSPQFSMTLANATKPAGVVVQDVVTDPAPALLRYEPSHPDANKEGYVAYPNINPVTEMADLMGAVRSYQMNVSAVNAAKQMITNSLELLR